MPDRSASVVIPTWSRAPWLDRCLRALAQQQQSPGEIVVVGRPVDSEAQEIVRRWKAQLACPVRWIEVGRAGHVAPVQTGLEEARFEFAVFLDDDTEPEEEWLDALLAPFEDPDVACVGGRVVTPGSRAVAPPDAGQVLWYGKHVANVGALDVSHPIDVDGVMEGNWAWRASVIRSLIFDSVLDVDDASMYGLDLCLQTREKGLRVLYTPRARVLHHAAPRDPSLKRADGPRRTAVYSRNYTYIALKHLRGLRRAAFLCWWFLVGERGSYGAAKGIADVLLRGRSVLPIIAASFRGKWQGVRAWSTVGGKSPPRLRCVG